MGGIVILVSWEKHFYQGMRESLTISTYSISIVLKHRHTFNFVFLTFKFVDIIKKVKIYE